MFTILIRARLTNYYTLLVSSTNKKYLLFFNIKKNETKYMFGNMFDKNISFKWFTFKYHSMLKKKCKYANNQRIPQIHFSEK